MNHRRYLPKPQPLDRAPRNNQTRLKNIYEAQFVFKDKNQALRKTSKKRQQSPPKVKVQQLNLAQLKPSLRYGAQRQSKDNRDQRDNSVHLYLNSQHERAVKHRYSKEPVVLTSRNRDQSMTDRTQMFKIRRKSISGSLKKKMKQQNAQYLSANPVLPVELNYYEEARKLYKQGKTSQALSLFQITLEKHPDMPQAHYHIALCLLSKHQYQKAYEHLMTVIEKFPKFNKKTVYLFASIAAKNIEKVDKAITLLGQGIEKYPDYTDLYVYRAKLEEQCKEYQGALEDYEHALKSRKDNAELWLNYALCLKASSRTSNCLSALNSALYCESTPQIKSKILLQRIKLFYQGKKIKQCKKDLAKLEELQSENSELFLYKGMVQLLQKNKRGALLSFEKCIRINNCDEAVASSLVEIAKSKIEDRDFYSANYHINRAQHLQVSSTDIHKFKLFAQGVVFLMKRKINEGVQNLNTLQQNYELGPYFNKLFYLYRAFGLFMQNKHKEAIEDYKKSEEYTPKDKHISYNQLIAEGIVMVNEKEYEKALEKFDQAQTVISQGGAPLKTEPFIYRAMTFAEKTRNMLNKDDLQTLEEVFVALKQLDKAYDINDSNSNMLFLRALIYMHLGKTDDGLQDIVKAISKSQQNVAKYFFFRALAHQTLGNTKQALNDFNICINLDEKHALAYFERAKLLFGNQQASKGLEDIKKNKELDPQSDSKAHECALFYLNKEFDLAQNCLPHIINPDKQRKYQIWIHFKQLRISQAKQKLTSPADQMICDIMIGQWSTPEILFDELQFFTKMQYFCYMGIKYFNLKQYEEAINQFSIAIKQKTLMDLQQNSQLEVEDQYGDGDDYAEPPVECETKANELHYLHYNLFLSYLANNQSKKAYEVFIRDLLPAKQHFLRSDNVGSLSRMIFQTMKVKQGQNIDKEVMEFHLFRSMLGESSDTVDIQLPNFILRTRLCYLMPFARQIYNEYSARINPTFMLEFIRISEVQNRPEPPWVKRNNQDLIFTDQIINIDVEFQTTQHDQESEDENQDEQGDDEGGQEDEAEEDMSQVPESREAEVFDPRRFKEQMRLDDDLERKLQKIMAAKKSSNDQ